MGVRVWDVYEKGTRESVCDQVRLMVCLCLLRVDEVVDHQSAE